MEDNDADNEYFSNIFLILNFTPIKFLKIIQPSSRFIIIISPASIIQIHYETLKHFNLSR